MGKQTTNNINTQRKEEAQMFREDINEQKQTINNINTQHMDEIVFEDIYVNNLEMYTPEVVWKQLKEILEEYDDSWNTNDDEPCETAHERRWIKCTLERY